jgi:hypothetical protein
VFKQYLLYGFATSTFVLSTWQASPYQRQLLADAKWALNRARLEKRKVRKRDLLALTALPPRFLQELVQIRAQRGEEL